MNRHYKKGNSLTVKLLGDSSSMYYYGYAQKVLVFTDKPEDAFTFYIIPISYPNINYAYFKNSEKNWQYGEAVNLTVHYHNLCSQDFETRYSQVFVVEDNARNRAIHANEGDEIDFKDLIKSSVWMSNERRIEKLNENSNGANATASYDILINYEEWRKGEIKEKQFSVIAVVYYKTSRDSGRV